MLHLSHLSFYHRTHLRPLIENLNLTVHPGDKVALIGEEGAGKSSLFDYLVAPQQKNPNLQIEGEMTNTFSRTAYLRQMTSLDELIQTLEEFIFGDVMDLDFNCLYQLADQLHFDSRRFESQQRLAQLSGGERLKLRLIKILAQRPDLLLLDEPTTDLDEESLSWLATLIQDLEIAIMFISHDEWFLSQTAEKIVHIEQVKKHTVARVTVAPMSYKDYLRHRQSTFAKQAQIAHKEREEFQDKMTQLNQHKSAVAYALRTTNHDAIGRLLAKKMKNLKSREARFEKEAENFTEIPMQADAIHLFFSACHPLPANKVILHFENMPLKVGDTCLATAINLTVKGQDKIAITGPNGCGKSTLLRHIRTQLAQTDFKIQYLPQDGLSDIDQDQSALAYLTEVATPELARTYLAKLQFTRSEIHQPLSALSGGQLAKVRLCYMVLSAPEILLLDEPSRFFSPTSQPEIRQLFSAFKGAIICVSHDRYFIKEVCQQTYRLHSTGLAYR